MDKTILFVDGENLVFRYQDEIAKGREPADGVIHEKDCFVWHPKMTSISHFDLMRVCYYTTVVGDDVKVEHVRKRLSQIRYEARAAPNATVTGQIVPMVYKKAQQSRKTRVVDVHLIIDVLRYARSEMVDQIYLASGDEDYLPLAREVMHSGRQLFIAAFSSGLAQSLTYNCDEFFELDPFFFKK